jgi:peroxiredoxin Q/BCP
MTKGLAEGDKAPKFTLPDASGGDVSLADFKGKKLVLYFYPKADTPGCTTEALDFSRLAKSFAKVGTAVLGVSADPVRKLDRFRQKHDLTVRLLSDEGHAVLEAYGVWGEKKLYGRTFMGVKRTTVLIGPDGRIARLWQNVKVPGHADEVLAAAKAL